MNQIIASMCGWMAVVLLVTAASSCDRGKEAGGEGGPCYGNGSCNEGLACLSETCVRPPPTHVDDLQNKQEQADRARREAEAARVRAEALKTELEQVETEYRAVAEKIAKTSGTEQAELERHLEELRVKRDQLRARGKLGPAGPALKLCPPGQPIC